MGYGEEKNCIDPKDLWSISSVNVIRNMGGSGAYQSAPHKEGQKGDVAIGEVCHTMLDHGFMVEARSKDSAARERERAELYAALQNAACFYCLVEKWKDCEELEPKPKEK